MRRILPLVLASLVLLAPASPAGASLPSIKRSTTLVLNAFWYLTERVSADEYLDIVWYVGVFEHDGDPFSDLYQTVDRCNERDGRDRCRPETFSIGFTDLSGGSYELDDRGLTEASLDETYPLKTYDRHGDRIGDVTPTRIVAELNGAGELQEDGSRRFRRTDCAIRRVRTQTSRRDQEAYGAVDGVGIGETYDAFLLRIDTERFELDRC